MRFVFFPAGFAAMAAFMVGMAAVTHAPAAFAQAPSTFAQAGLSLRFPASYPPPPSGQPVSPNSVFSRTGPTQNGVPSNINLTQRPLPPTVTVYTKTMAEASAKMAQKSIPSYTLLSSGTILVGGESAGFVMARINVQGHEMQAKQVLVAHKHSLYTFTFGAAAPLSAAQVAEFDKMLASVKWL